MTISEAIIQSLEDTKSAKTASEIFEHIILKNYYDFSGNKNPESTVNSIAHRMIKNGDTRIKRTLIDKSGYNYYLAKYEAQINFDNLGIVSSNSYISVQNLSSSFKERDLHKLLCSYLKTIGINAKTIFHEKNTKEDEKQKWTNPDIIGVQLLTLNTETSSIFLKTINKESAFKIFSYEIKKEINNDYELKKAYFQAVSNSSWANFGYLVAFEIDDNLSDEIERLNQSFGIGVIKLSANPYRSKIIFQSKYRSLDIKTIDKLCKNNKDYKNFIEIMDKLLNADKKYYEATEKELIDYCDECFYDNKIDEIIKYCEIKNIPFEDDDFE